LHARLLIFSAIFPAIKLGIDVLAGPEKLHKLRVREVAGACGSPISIARQSPGCSQKSRRFAERDDLAKAVQDQDILLTALRNDARLTKAQTNVYRDLLLAVADEIERLRGHAVDSG
jgi:hypothetical protein